MMSITQTVDEGGTFRACLHRSKIALVPVVPGDLSKRAALVFPCYKAAMVALALGLPDLYSIVTPAGGTTVHPVNTTLGQVGITRLNESGI